MSMLDKQEVFVSDDSLTTKIIHADNSETAVKMVSSCDTIRNPVTGKLEHNSIDRNKYSVFASASHGCFMKCKFCYLTMKGMKYAKLDENAILENLKSALAVQADHDPDIADRYVKLCWMGMGEDQMIRPDRTARLTMDFLTYVMDNKLAAGVDGVDLATVLPPHIHRRWMDVFHELDYQLKQFPTNPNNKLMVHAQGATGPQEYINRSRFRVFYSLHSAIQETRNEIIPGATPLDEAVATLKDYAKGNQHNVIFHHMFIHGVNDSDREIDALINFHKKHGLEKYEFRILRYNHCDNTPLSESDRFETILDRLAAEIPFLKVQISVGSEVRAACGQFIVRQFTDWNVA
jgi:adenine C2-methylase RlmN of 23S rRNA A2503 and tRNA A37